MKKSIKKAVKKTSVKKTTKSEKNKKAYIPIHERELKVSVFSNTISKHASHNPNKSGIRGVENAQLRNTIDKMKKEIINIDITGKDFSALIPKDKKALKNTFEKTSLFDRLRTKILKLLIKKGYNKKALFSFIYKHRDTKEGDIISLSTRVRTAMRALYYNNEHKSMKQIELHKVSRIVPKSEIQLVKYYNE